MKGKRYFAATSGEKFLNLLTTTISISFAVKLTSSLPETDNTLLKILKMMTRSFSLDER